MRLCACPRKEPIGEHRGPRAIYASDACRARHWKERTGYTKPRSENAENAAQRKRPSGVQVSYRKAVQAAVDLAEEIEVCGGDRDELAETFMRRALSPRARAQVERQRQEAA